MGLSGTPFGGPPKWLRLQSLAWDLEQAANRYGHFRLVTRPSEIAKTKMANFKCETCGEILSHKEVVSHRCAVGDEFDNVPDVLGEVPAFRSWNVDLNGTLLSLNGARWRPGGYMVATCQPFGTSMRLGRGHTVSEIPVKTCSCGIYAAKDREHLADMQYNRWTPGDDPYPRVIGEVALSGKIIPGTQGYRALKARPTRIWVPYEAWRMVEKIQKMYGIPVDLDNTLR